MLSPIRPRPTKPSCIDSSQHSEVPFSTSTIVDPERVDLHLPANVGRPFRVAFGPLERGPKRPVLHVFETGSTLRAHSSSAAAPTTSRSAAVARCDPAPVNARALRG